MWIGLLHSRSLQKFLGFELVQPALGNQNPGFRFWVLTFELGDSCIRSWKKPKRKTHQQNTKTKPNSKTQNPLRFENLGIL